MHGNQTTTEARLNQKLALGLEPALPAVADSIPSGLTRESNNVWKTLDSRLSPSPPGAPVMPSVFKESRKLRIVCFANLPPAMTARKLWGRTSTLANP